MHRGARVQRNHAARGPQREYAGHAHREARCVDEHVQVASGQDLREAGIVLRRQGHHQRAVRRGGADRGARPLGIAAAQDEEAHVQAERPQYVFQRRARRVEARSLGRGHEPSKTQLRSARAIGPQQRHGRRALRRDQRAVRFREARCERAVRRVGDGRQASQRFGVLERECALRYAVRDCDLALGELREQRERQARGNRGLRGEFRGHLRRRDIACRTARGQRGQLRARVVRRQLRRLRRAVHGGRNVAACQRDLRKRETRRRERAVLARRDAPFAHRVVGEAELPQYFAEMEVRDRRGRIFARSAAEARDRVRGTPFHAVHAPTREPVVERRGGHRVRPNRVESLSASFACRRDAARRTRVMKPTLLRQGPVGALQGR